MGSVDNNNSIISYEKRPSSCATTVIALSGRCTFLRFLFFFLIIYIYYYQLQTKRISTKAEPERIFSFFSVLFHNLHSFGFECYLKTGIFRPFLLVGAFSRTHTHPTRSAARRCVITALLCPPFRTCVDFSSVRQSVFFVFLACRRVFLERSSFFSN